MADASLNFFPQLQGIAFEGVGMVGAALVEQTGDVSGGFSPKANCTGIVH